MAGKKTSKTQSIERKNVLKKKAKNRTKAISDLDVNKMSDTKNAHFSNIVADIQQNGKILFGNQQTYIHNHSINFIEGAKAANAILRSKFGEIKDAWIVEAAGLKELCEKKEQDFFAKLQSSLGKAIDRKGFQKLLNDSVGSFDINLNEVIATFKDLPEGQKTVGQLKTIIQQVKNINAGMKKLNQSGDFNQHFMDNLQAMEEQFKSFEQWCEQLEIDDNAMTYNGKELQNTEGISTRRVMLYVLPNALENLIVAALKKIGTQKIKEQAFSVIHTASETAKGSTADVSILGTGFSIKMNKTKIKQEKNRIMKTFFDWNENLNEPETVPLNVVNQVLNRRTGGASAVNILNYLFLNYGALSQINADDILEDAWRTVILSNLNQKLFGYNKSGQKNMSTEEVINNIPVAGINGNGELVWYADLINDILQKISNDRLNIKSLAGYKLNSAFYNNTALSRAKRKAMPQLEELNYKNLKSAVSKELNAARKELLNSIQISIQYHINISSIINKQQ